MTFFKRIFAAILAFLCSVFPFLNKTEMGEAGTYVVNDSSLTVYVSSNPSTGYTWEYDIEGDCIEFAESTYKSSATAENISGAGGTAAFTFTGKSEGSFVIAMQYLRTWEDTIPAQRVSISGVTDGQGNITVTEFKAD